MRAAGDEEVIVYVLSGLACALAAATFVVLLVRKPPSSAVDLHAFLKRQRHAGAVGPHATAAPTARARPPVSEPPARRPTRSREAEDRPTAEPVATPPPGPARGPDSAPAEPTSEPEAPPAPAGLASPADPASGSQPPPAAASRRRPSSGTPARDAPRAAARAAGAGKSVPAARSATPPTRDAAATDVPAGPRRKPALASAQPATRDASPPSAGRKQAPAAKRRASAAPSTSASGGVGTRRAAPRTPAEETAAICQVHWLGRGRGSCFSAVTVDAHGAKHSLATSRRVEWRGSMPPAETPDSQAALRQLSKILRDNGWQPMRGNGEDFGQERWYARRFREVPARAAPGGAGTRARRPPRAKDDTPG